MTWNHRLVDFGTYIAICEVYYSEGRLSRTGPISLVADTAEDIKEDMDLMLKAFDQPILNNAEHFPDSIEMMGT